jgi:DNA polymerase-3 subunit epsilon
VPKLIASWFGRNAALAPDERDRLERWRAEAETDLRMRVDRARFVVTDVEATGLDLRADHLIAIGAVRIDGGKIQLRHSFYTVLRQHQPSDRANILVHGIGGTAQREGSEPAQALLAFLEFAGKALLVGYHAPFDETMIRKAGKSHLGVSVRRPWLDLARLAPALVPEAGSKEHQLDSWLERFGIEVFRRHDAIADALATAQLLQVLLDRAVARGMQTLGDLRKEAAAQRWLARQ